VNEPWTTLKVLTWTTGRFTERGLDSPRLDAEVLLAHLLATDRVGLYTAFDQPLGDAELAAYRALIKRRLAGEPVAYLVGEQEFWSMPLFVSEAVLIPRRDTETLVEVALRAARQRPHGPIAIADVCTGSGCVALALAKELPAARVVASDVSAAALAVAQKNAARHDLGARVELVQGDLTAPLAAGAPYDLVVSNPPYVRSAEALSAEVRREPALALFGGADGLEIIARLVPAARDLLAVGGVLAIEHGFDQGAEVRASFSRAGLGEIATTKDLAGHERVTAGQRV
jgi:release factor glutamine methyltransferase